MVDNMKHPLLILLDPLQRIFGWSSSGCLRCHHSYVVPISPEHPQCSQYEAKTMAMMSKSSCKKNFISWNYTVLFNHQYAAPKKKKKIGLLQLLHASLMSRSNQLHLKICNSCFSLGKSDSTLNHIDSAPDFCMGDFPKTKIGLLKPVLLSVKPEVIYVPLSWIQSTIIVIHHPLDSE